MSLLHVQHTNRKQAAISVTANRASKVRLLCDSGARDLAATNAAHLASDVREYITTSPPDPMHAQELWRMVQGAAALVEV